MRNAVQVNREAHPKPDGASAANCLAKPTTELPRSLSKKRDRKVTRAANVLVKPEQPKPPELSKRSRKAARPAIVSTQPNAPSPGDPSSSGQLSNDPHLLIAVAGDDHLRNDAQFRIVIATIQELWRRRQSWHRAEKSLTLQCSAICRRTVGARGITVGMTPKEKTANGKLLVKAREMLARIEKGEITDADKDAAMSCMPILAGRTPLEKERAQVEKTLEKLAKSLPVYEWLEPIRGIGPGSLAAIVGECGDVGSYKSVSAVWKRMGLAVIQGGRQRRVSGADAVEHGYSPKRRSVMWNIGGCLIGGMGKGPRPKVGENIELRDDWSVYQKEFVSLLRSEVERVTDTWNGPEHKREPVERDGELYESFSSHAAARCKRRIEKQFLAELYGAWRDRATIADTKPMNSLSPAISKQAA